MFRNICAVVVTSTTLAGPLFAFDLADYTRHIAPASGTALAATPGQRFYEDTWLKFSPQYEIPAAFEGRMPGAMGIRFSFAIDSTILSYVGKSRDGSLDYYVPEDGKFRAWHGVVGNVLSPGDTVGLRVARNGAMEWFVDNSIHNNMTTIWRRPVKKDDPVPTKSRSAKARPFGAPIRQLEYLGVRGSNVAIRLIQLDPDLPPRMDEFLFPIDTNGHVEGVVMGAEFQIRVLPNQRAEIVVTTPMADEYADKLPTFDKEKPMIRPGDTQAALQVTDAGASQEEGTRRLVSPRDSISCRV